MESWREVFRLDRDDVNFEMVHARYREMMMNLAMPATLDDLQRLNWALEEARKELGSGRPAFKGASSSQ